MVDCQPRLNEVYKSAVILPAANRGILEYIRRQVYLSDQPYYIFSRLLLGSSYITSSLVPLTTHISCPLYHRPYDPYPPSLLHNPPPMSKMTLSILQVFLASTLAIDKTLNPDLSSRLKLSTTNLDRLSLLPKNSDWTFNFSDQEKYTFAPGSVVNANAATFPALTGLGMTIAMLNLGPCAMLPPHMHPRATNLVVGISGNTTSWMVNENGAGLVQVNLLPMVRNSCSLLLK